MHKSLLYCVQIGFTLRSPAHQGPVFANYKNNVYVEKTLYGTQDGGFR